MSETPTKSFMPMIVAVAMIGVAAGMLVLINGEDPAKRWLSAFALVATVPAFGLPYLFPRKPAESEDTVAPLVRQVADGRNAVINAMSGLQQELRGMQESRKGDSEQQMMREEIARLAAEVAALKLTLLTPVRPASVEVKPAPTPVVVAPAPKAPAPKPVAEEDDADDFDVAPLSFDDDEEEAPVAKKPAPAAAPAPAPKAVAKPEPVFEPEVVAEEKGLEPEDMEDDGDWLTGGLDEDDLVVTKKIDFDAIVKKDAERPKPAVDPEEQRILREEMAQMADSDDWVGGGLQDRDVKVRKNTVNDALFEKFRAEIEAKRTARESATGVRAPARGETALIANVTVPHGAKLFVRGIGPGLSVDSGSPMQQSGHGKWQWICGEQGKACVVTIWENDQVQAEGNPVRVPAGFALTVTPTFRRKIKM